MTEYAGTLQLVELCSTLWLIPLFPLLAAVACLLAPKRARRWGPVAATLAFVISVAHVIELSWQAPNQRCLFDHLFNVARIGSLSVAFELSFDPLSAVFIVLVSGVAVLALARAAEIRSDARGLAAYNLMLGAMLVLLLADNLFVFIIGWHVVALAAYLIFTEREPTADVVGGRTFYVVNRLGDGALIAGAALLFWTLGGGFGPHGRYAPNYRPPLISVRVVRSVEQFRKQEKKAQQGALSQGGAGELAMTALPGATISTGGARLCRVDRDGNPGGYGTLDSPCRSRVHPPFVHLPLTAVMYDLTIDAGPGESPLTVEHLRIDPGATTEIIEAGPTLSFHAMRDQLHVIDADGHPVFRQALAQKTVWGMPALSVALFLFLMAVAARSALWPMHVWLGAITRVRPSAGALIAGPIGLASGAYLVARLAFFLPLAPTVAVLIGLLGALTSVLAAGGALFAGSLRRMLGLFAIGQVGVVFIGLGVGAFAPAVLELAVATLSVAGLWLGAASMERAVDPDAEPAAEFADLAGIGVKQSAARAYSWSALAAVAAPIPALGVFWTRGALLWRAFNGSNVFSGALLAALGALASLALSFAVWRSYYLMFSGASARLSKKSKAELARFEGWLTVLGALALVAGLAGFSGRAWGLSFAAPIAGWLAPLRTAGGASQSLGLVSRAIAMAVSFALPLLGWWQARKRYGPSRSADWRERERSVIGFPWLSRAVELSGAYDTRFARGAEWVGRGIARLDAALDRPGRARAATSDREEP